MAHMRGHWLVEERRDRMLRLERLNEWDICAFHDQSLYGFHVFDNDSILRTL